MTTYEEALAHLTEINRVANAMNIKKLNSKPSTYQEKIAYWQFARQDYNEWRFTPEAHEWIKKKRERQHNLCFICLIKLDNNIHIDHIYPLFVGGTNSKANMCLTHPSCNMVKGASVTMTYKEACNRRKLFNRMGTGIKLYSISIKKPDYILSKKEQSYIDLAREHELI